MRSVRRCSSQAGGVKSPVPSSVMPFVIAPPVSVATVRSRLHAREYFQWMWRSAIHSGIGTAVGSEVGSRVGSGVGSATAADESAGLMGDSSPSALEGTSHPGMPYGMNAPHHAQVPPCGLAIPSGDRSTRDPAHLYGTWWRNGVRGAQLPYI